MRAGSRGRGGLCAVRADRGLRGAACAALLDDSAELGGPPPACLAAAVAGGGAPTGQGPGWRDATGTAALFKAPRGAA